MQVNRRYDRRAFEVQRARENARFAQQQQRSQPQIVYGGGGGGAPNPTAQQSRDLIVSHTLGRGQAIQDDPMLQESNAYFQNVMRGGNLPFGQQQTDAMKAQAAGMNADAEAANARAFNERYAAGGGNINDPASIAKRQEMREERQGANQQAATAVDTQAALANYQAQMAAAQALGQGRRAQFGIANNPIAQGVAFLGNDKAPNAGGYGGYNSMYDLFMAAMGGGL